MGMSTERTFTTILSKLQPRNIVNQEEGSGSTQETQETQETSSTSTQGLDENSKADILISLCL